MRAAAVARHLAATGSEGLVVAGTTGEGPVLTDAERIDLFRAVVGSGRRPGHRLDRDQRHRPLGDADQARPKSCGVHAVLAVTPYYNRPSPAGLSAHFRAIAAASDLPGGPLRHPRPLGTADRPRAHHRAGPQRADHRRRQGCHRRRGQPRRSWWRRAPTEFDVYCGDDSLTLPFLSIGGAGIISVAAHWAGRLFAEMISSYRSGDVERATAVNQQLAESYRFESTDEYPQPGPGQGRLPGPRAGGRPVPTAQSVRHRATLEDQARAVISKLSPLIAAHQSVA